MPANIATILDDPQVAAVRAQCARFAHRYPAAARASFVAKVYGGNMPAAALAHLGAAEDARNERAARATDHMNGSELTALARAEARFPELLTRDTQPAAVSDAAAAALAHLDRVLPMPNVRRSEADEQARVADIRAIARMARQTEEGERLVALGATVEQARAAIIAKKAAESGAEICNIAPTGAGNGFAPAPIETPVRGDKANAFDAIASRTYSDTNRT